MGAARSRQERGAAIPPARRMADLLKNLSPSRQEVIRPVLEHSRDYVLLTIRESAAKLHSDPATILRIVRTMGFPTYREFQWYLHELSIVLATPLQMMQASLAETGDSLSLVRESLAHDMRNLRDLSSTLDIDRLRRLAKRLYAARKIVLLGGDMATILVSFLEYKLTILGLPPMVATTPGRVVHLVRSVAPGDVVIGISFRRCLRQTVDGLEQAKACGAYCVGITDTYISPIARVAQECWIVSIENPSFGGSYVAPMALLNGLMVACAGHRRAKVLALLKEAEAEQRHGFRWYPG